MTSKLKCPFCGAELQTDNEIARLIMWRCHTPGCLLNGWHSAEIIQHLIDGKKAQEDLEYVKEELKCAKHNYSVLSEQKEIAYQNYLKITGDLQTQLQKTQEALKVATDCIENIGDTWRGDIRWTNDDMDEIRINTERYCDSILKKIKGAKK